jgi:hypothetical protein
MEYIDTYTEEHPGLDNPPAEMKRVTHLQKKHPGLYNPLPETKRVTVFDSYCSKPMPNASNSFSRRDDFLRTDY